MKRAKYCSGLTVKQRSNPGFASIRRTGVTVSEQLTIRRHSDRDDYCLPTSPGSSREEWVHYATLEIVEEAAR